jgi:hypothetical protein
MVCYARSATSIGAVALVAFVVFGRAAAHLIDVTALMVAVSVVAGGTAIAAGLIFLALRSVRRRRALAGGCVACQLKCQHAMTGTVASRAGAGAFGAGAGRLWLVSSVDRGASAAGSASVRGPAIPDQRPVVPDQRPVVKVPAPRWPDSPLRADAPRQQVPVPAAAAAH